VTHVLAIPALPFLAFVLLAVVPPLRRRGRGAGVFSIVCIGGSLAAALGLLTMGYYDFRRTWSWIPSSAGPVATVGVYVDELAQAMVVLVTLVAFLVQIYSLGYLHHERPAALGRYYAYQSLFAFSMLGLVLAPGFLQMFIFWELVGLCSYLLIGYWYERPAAARAAVKAFWITRLGDLGFIIGIVLLWRSTGTFDFAELFARAEAGELPVEGLGLTMTLIYLGAVGKSAQFPLHVWLPDAMEGPTPVSALIHAATMVTAGVFMATRAFPLFGLTPDVLTLVGWVGAFTALLAATMACVEADIKRVLAYSTISQLGYMMAAIGAGAPGAGFFHLLTHGVFKALLFLAAGAVIHAVGTNDIFRMGRLFRALPQTGIVFLVGTLALAGIWPFAGFFSKEDVLAGVWEGSLLGPFVLLALTAFLTAFYMFRVVILAFFGPGTAVSAGSHSVGPSAPQAAGGVRHGPSAVGKEGSASPTAEAHLHDPPAVMTLPLWVLSALTVVIGLWSGLTGEAEHEAPEWLAPLSLALAGAGIILAGLTYQWQVVSATALAWALAPFDVMARRRYGLDAAYVGLYRGFILGFSSLIGWIDRYVVDGVLNVVSAWTLRGGDHLRGMQSGKAQDYVYGVAAGLLALIIWSQWWK
jgi:NADH-quinone oxidoreductase subunit L